MTPSATPPSKRATPASSSSAPTITASITAQAPSSSINAAMKSRNTSASPMPPRRSAPLSNTVGRSSHRICRFPTGTSAPAPSRFSAAAMNLSRCTTPSTTTKTAISIRPSTSCAAPTALNGRKRRIIRFLPRPMTAAGRANSSISSISSASAAICASTTTDAINGRTALNRSACPFSPATSRPCGSFGI